MCVCVLLTCTDCHRIHKLLPPGMRANNQGQVSLLYQLIDCALAVTGMRKQWYTMSRPQQLLRNIISATLQFLTSFTAKPLQHYWNEETLYIGILFIFSPLVLNIRAYLNSNQGILRSMIPHLTHCLRVQSGPELLAPWVGQMGGYLS